MINVTSDNFDETVIGSEKPVLLDFWAVWCGPCKMQSPIVDALDSEQDNFVIGKVDIDQYPELAQKYRVMAVPTLMVFKDGKMVSSISGLQSKEQILDTMSQFI